MSLTEDRPGPRRLSALVAQFGTRIDPRLVQILLAQERSLPARESRIEVPVVLGLRSAVIDHIEYLAKLGLKIESVSGNVARGSFEQITLGLIEQLLRERIVRKIELAGRVTVLMRADGASIVPNAGSILALCQSAETAEPSIEAGRIAIGVIDYGCDFLHPALRTGEGGSRVKWLWDQNGTAGPQPSTFTRVPGLSAPVSFDFGAEHDRATIDGWIATFEASAKDLAARGQAYSVYDPHRGYYQAGVTQGAHGTHVTSIAAGSHLANGFRGVAPETDIIFVQLAISASDWVDTLSGVSAAQPIWHQYSDTAKLVAALEYVYARAAADGYLGVAVNVSLGTWSGAHDGRSQVEERMDEITRGAAEPTAVGAPMVSFVVAAGNGADATRHESVVLQTGAEGMRQAAVEIAVDPRALGPREIGFWYLGDRRRDLEISLTAPKTLWRRLGIKRAQATVPLPIDQADPLAFGGVTLGGFTHQRGYEDETGHTPFCVNLLFDLAALAPRDLADAEAPPDIWVIRLKARAGSGRTLVHSWIERTPYDEADTAFEAGDTESTLSSLACGSETIVVGAQALPDLDPASLGPLLESSAGPKPWHPGQPGRHPHLCAPGDSLAAACSGREDFLIMSGTSMAAPCVTGAVALMMAAAVERGRGRLGTSEVRDKLISAAEVRRPEIMTDRPVGWDFFTGFGPLDVRRAVESV